MKSKRMDGPRSGATSGNERIVRLLLEKGAYVDSVNNFGLTVAALKGHAKIVSLLREHGAEIDRTANGKGLFETYDIVYM